MKRRFIQINGELVEREPVTTRTFEVMPDFQPFVANDGKVIEGRRQWREHLKNTNGVEMGHGDIKRQTETWNKKQAANAAKVAEGQKYIKPAEFKPDAHAEGPSRLSIEVANRLHGKERPSRRELVQLAVELKRREVRR